MTRSKVIALSAAALLATANSGIAASVVALGGDAPKESTITAIGKAPVKVKKDLKLGSLRTRNAELPGGTRTLSERMKLRAKKAMERQRAVTSATRKKPKTTNEEGDDSSTSME